VRFGYTPLTTLVVKCVGKTMWKDLNSLGLLWAVTYSISAQVGSSAALPLCMCLISKSLYIASDGRVSVAYVSAFTQTCLSIRSLNKAVLPNTP